jgi:uncharacterized membrane protein YoaK (UPF0700 family)
VLFLGSAIEAGLVALAVLVAAFNPILADAWAGYAVIAVLGIAMGIQNAVVRGLGVRDLTTTVLTLTLTGLAADSVFGGGANAGFSRRTASVVSMFAGALVGTLAVLHVSALVALVLPLIGALLVALVAGVLNRTNPAWSAPARTTSA